MSTDPGETWAAWLREQLDRHGMTNADLVRASGTKPNGRPVIDASTVTQWLRGRRPSFHLATVAAESMDASISQALIAAGYEVGALQLPADPVSVGPDDQGAPVEEDTLLYKRPEGLTDDGWEQMKQDTRGYLEWLIEKASRER